MAQPAGVLTRRGTNSLANNGDDVREDLTDTITNISPTERPFHQNAGRGDASSDYHEWLIDTLADAVVDNAHVDGDDFNAEGQTDQLGSGSDGVQISGGERLGNYMQISRKDIVVSRRANIVRKAGRKSELSYQIAKAGRELQRDCEAAALNAGPAVAGSDTVAPITAGVPAWIKTNDLRVTGGASPTLSNGADGFPNQALATTDGTTPIGLDEADLLSVIGEAFIQGGDPDTIMLYPTIKQRFSQYMFGSTARIATQYQDQGSKPGAGAQVMGAVDFYVSDFGVLDVVPNRFQRQRDALVLEMDMWDVVYLDGYHVEKMGKTGDSEKRVMVTDWGVRSKNEAASGVVADVANVAMTAAAGGRT